MMKSKKEANNRIEDRRHLIYYLKVEDKNSGKIVGRIVDITRQGVLLISDSAYDNSDTISVRIELGDELFARMHGHLDLKIVCRWSKKDINPDYFVNGFEFVNQTPAQELVIRNLIDLIGFRD